MNNSMKTKEPKVFLFGDWSVKDKPERCISEEGKFVAEWILDLPSSRLENSVGDVEALKIFGQNIRKEFLAQQRYREIVGNSMIELRNVFLKKAESIIPNLSISMSTPEDAYRQGLAMGEHAICVEAAQKISDILDKLIFEVK